MHKEQDSLFDSTLQKLAVVDNGHIGSLLSQGLHAILALLLPPHNPQRTAHRCFLRHHITRTWRVDVRPVVSPALAQLRALLGQLRHRRPQRHALLWVRGGQGRSPHGPGLWPRRRDASSSSWQSERAAHFSQPTWHVANMQHTRLHGLLLPSCFGCVELVEH